MIPTKYWLNFSSVDLEDYMLKVNKFSYYTNSFKS